jgi:hypothetical protein
LGGRKGIPNPVKLSLNKAHRVPLAQVRWRNVMVAEVFAGLGALKTAFDIAKGLKDIDDATRRNAAVR